MDTDNTDEPENSNDLMDTDNTELYFIMNNNILDNYLIKNNINNNNNNNNKSYNDIYDELIYYEDKLYNIYKYSLVQGIKLIKPYVIKIILYSFILNTDFFWRLYPDNLNQDEFITIVKEFISNLNNFNYTDNEYIYNIYYYNDNSVFFQNIFNIHLNNLYNFPINWDDHKKFPNVISITDMNLFNIHIISDLYNNINEEEINIRFEMINKNNIKSNIQKIMKTQINPQEFIKRNLNSNIKNLNKQNPIQKQKERTNQNRIIQLVNRNQKLTQNRINYIGGKKSRKNLKKKFTCKNNKKHNKIKTKNKTK